MKRRERDKAILLRQQGQSLNDIAARLRVAKATVSLWVRDIKLTQAQRNSLTKRGFSMDAIEKRRINRIRNTSIRHRRVIDEAKKRIKELSPHELLLVGSALYWGEGGKTIRASARISNSDPNIIRFMMRFFREVCKVQEEKFRGHVHTFSHLNARQAERYWSGISGIPVRNFYKTYVKKSRASRDKKDSLPFGTVQIYVNDTNLFLTISGWIEKLGEIGLRNDKKQ